MFAVSLILVLLSSYLIASTAFGREKSKFNPLFLIFLITVFAQVVLTFEMLSLFKAINELNVILLNSAFLIGSAFVWFKTGKPLAKFKIKSTLKRILKALKKDKILMIMAFGLLFFIALTILLNLFMPISSYDALTYHLNRSAYWLTQGSLNHFDVTDDRNLVMPINSEILYLWVLLFIKNDIGLGFVSFFGYLASIFSVYNILQFFGFSERRKLWAIFILSSLASVIAEASSLETDVLIAGLVLSSIALFIIPLKEGKIKYIFYSALAYAIAMGTKSPAIIAFPGVFLLLSFLSYKQLGKKAIKPLVIFLGLLFLNFMVFSSYNYILNLIQFSNPFGSEAARAIHGFRGGIKAVIANYIRYIFMLFDFSGFKYSLYVGEHITNAKLAIFSLLHIPENLGVEMTDNNEINNRLMEVKMGAGLLGFLLFLPSAITSIVIAFVKRGKTKAYSLAAFGAMFFFNLFCLSFSIAYMVFSIRFVSFLIIISAPVLALSYIKKTNFIKILILFFVMSYFLVMSANLSSRPVGDVIKVILQEKTLNDAREKIRCSMLIGFEGKMPFCYLRDMIESTPKEKTFGIFTSFNSRMYIIQMLNAKGRKVDTLMPEKADSYDLSKYDYLVTTDQTSISTLLLKDTKYQKIGYEIDKKGNAYYQKFRPLSCIYVDHISGNAYNPKDKNQTIVTAVCFMSKEFFSSKGFEFVQSYDFQSPMKENANFMTIYKKLTK